MGAGLLGADRVLRWASPLYFLHQNKERIDCTNDVGPHIKKISNEGEVWIKKITNEGKMYIWYSWSSGSYLRNNVDLCKK